MNFEMFRARSGGMGGGNNLKQEYYIPPKGWTPRLIKSGGGGVSIEELHPKNTEQFKKLEQTLPPTPTQPPDADH